ncbi:MAG: dihydroneopterin aldolase [Clostridiales bacterium]|nr:dihydroneopterin aldolase [Clostridiales bacterium]
MDCITMKDMKFYGYVGCLESEKNQGQNFYVTCEMFFEPSIKGCYTDDLNDTVDYSVIFDIIKGVVEEAEFDLIERLAQAIADKVLEFDNRIKKTAITVSKPKAPIAGEFGTMEVRIEREGNT